MVSKQVGAVFTILGGAFYIIGSFLGAIAGAGFLFGFFGAFSSGGCPYPSAWPFATCQSVNANSLGEAILLILAFGIATGALIITGGALLNSDSPGRRKSGGILAIAMMVLGALPTLGGLVIGFFFTLIGSVLGLTYKELSPDIVVGYQPVAAPTTSAVSRTGPLKFCIKCGSALHEGSSFCGVCGAEVPRS